jgi:hypothetical protein
LEQLIKKHHEDGQGDRFNMRELAYRAYWQQPLRRERAALLTYLLQELGIDIIV